jgi:hypothetical protein
MILGYCSRSRHFATTIVEPQVIASEMVLSMPRRDLGFEGRISGRGKCSACAARTQDNSLFGVQQRCNYRTLWHLGGMPEAAKKIGIDGVSRWGRDPPDATFFRRDQLTS